MLTFKKYGYTKKDIKDLEVILCVGRDVLLTPDCNKDCNKCVHKKACSDVGRLLDYLYGIYSTVKD